MKLHDQLLTTYAEASAAAAQLAAAEHVQLSEKIKNTNHTLEEAQRSLKKLEDQTSSRPTAPERKIDFDSPSRWTIAKDIDNLAQFFTTSFRDDGTKSIATEEEDAETTANEDKTAYPLKVLGAFLRKHLPHLQVKIILPGGAPRKIETDISDCITQHYDKILADFFLHSKVSTGGYQTIVTLISSKQGAEGLVRAVLPYGTKLPKLRST
jgi:hypothetical protein